MMRTQPATAHDSWYALIYIPNDAHTRPCRRRGRKGVSPPQESKALCRVPTPNHIYSGTSGTPRLVSISTAPRRPENTPSLALDPRDTPSSTNSASGGCLLGWGFPGATKSQALLHRLKGCLISHGRLTKCQLRGSGFVNSSLPVPERKGASMRDRWRISKAERVLDLSTYAIKSSSMLRSA